MRAVAAAALILMGAVACGGESSAPSIPSSPSPPEVHVIAAEVTPGRGGDGLLTFAAHNAGPETDTLVGASCRCAEDAELVGTGAIAPQVTVLFDVDGPHVELRALERGLRPGDGVDVTLTFEHAGDVAVRADVAR